MTGCRGWLQDALVREAHSAGGSLQPPVVLCFGETAFVKEGEHGVSISIREQVSPCVCVCAHAGGYDIRPGNLDHLDCNARKTCCCTVGLAAMLESYTGTGLNPGCSTPDPAEVPGKAVKDGPGTWVPAIHTGDPGRVPGSWLQPNPTKVSAQAQPFGT